MFRPFRLWAGILLLFCAGSAQSTTITSTANGNWSAGGTWVGGVAPGIGDTAVIAHTVTVDTNITVGTSPVQGTATSPNAVVTINAGKSLIVASGVTFDVRGDLVIANSTLTMTGTAILQFDPSVAVAPTTTHYHLVMGNGFSQPNTLLTSSGTSAGTQFTIQTIAGTYAAAGVICDTKDRANYNLAYGKFLRMGDSSNDALEFSYQAAATTETLDNITFDTCGLVNTSDALPAANGFSITNCRWTGSIGANKSGSSPAHICCIYINAGNVTLNTGVTRTLSGCIFDQVPDFNASGMTVSGCYFGKAFDTGASTYWTSTFSGNFIHCIDNTNGAGLAIPGNVTGNYIISDVWPTASSQVTGTSSGSNTGTTFKDTSKSWTTNQWQSTGSYGANYFLLITAGTGINQVRCIYSNTSNTCTISPAWTVTPDNTSAYALYKGWSNVHWVQPESTTAGFSGVATSGTTTTLLTSHTFTATNQYRFYTLTILYGTGAGETATITGSATSGGFDNLTFAALGTAPDSTSVFSVSVPYSYTNNILEETGADSQGDCFLHMDQAWANYTITGNIILNNTATDNSGTLMTLFTYAGTTVTQTGVATSTGATNSITMTTTPPGAWVPGTTLRCTSDAATNNIGVSIYVVSISGNTIVTTPALPTTPSSGATFVNQRNGTVDIQHNTYFTGSQSAAINETSIGSTCDTLNSFKSNLAWCNNVTYAGTSSLGPYKLEDDNGGQGALPGTHPTNVILPTQADYNGGYNQLAGYMGNGYNILTTVQPGAHDVNANPNFVAPTRGIESWAVTQGSVSTTHSGLVSDALSYLQATPSLVTNLLSYVKGGFAPQNSAFHNTAHDGTDIGAVPYSPPASVVNVFFNLFPM